MGDIGSILFGKKSLTGRLITPFRKGVQSVKGLFEFDDPSTFSEPPAEINDEAQKGAQEASQRERSRRRRARGRGATILTGPLAEANIGRRTLGGA